MRGTHPPAAESLGDLTSGVDARPAASVHDATANGRCRNCEAVTAGNFCSVCGQSTVLHPPTVLEFAHEFVGHYIALEGPLLRTLAALLLIPGRLTLEYFVGRRQRYIPPLRLYLTFSVILFALSGVTGGLRLGGGGQSSIEFNLPDEKSPEGAAIGLRAPREGSAANSWLQRTGKRIAGMSPEERTARVRGAVRQYLPSVLIVLVPLLALLFKLVYWKRRRLYGEHLVVAFHAQTVAFVFAMFASIPLGESWGDVVLVALFVHGAIALRRVYGGRWLPTIAREVFVLTIYGILVGAAAATIATASLIT